jgi:hypothetical protein
MAYTLVLDPGFEIELQARPEASLTLCEKARQGCLPAYVFSVQGQVAWREALQHLSLCQRRNCRSLRPIIVESMQEKLGWLLEENALLGCLHIQPSLYGAKRIVFNRQQFPQVAHHLAKCPKEACAKLRRSLLLRVRDQLRPHPISPRP